MSDLFLSNLPQSLSVSGNVEQRLLSEYGSMFVARNVIVPGKIVFRDEAEVSDFQSRLSIESEKIGAISIELQTAAMRALKSAIGSAGRIGLSMTPRDVDSARRSYDETVGLWTSRVEPGLDYWVAQGRLANGRAEYIRSLPPFEQVSEILTLEEDEIYFAKGLSKSIVYSVAPPGSSQHLSLLALDINEHDDPKVREILSAYEWFQTVISDLPHFTYLGIQEDRLPELGLKCVLSRGRKYWIPDM
jgi:hypothetical protein